MPTFPSDPTRATYLVLLLAVVVAAAVWFRTRTRKALVVTLTALLVVGGLAVVDRLAESPREEASRRVEAMADAATATDPNRFLEHLSKTFSLQGADRERVRKSGAWDQIRLHKARVAVWGLGHDDVEYKGDDEVEIGFYAKVQTPNREAVVRYVKATFVRDPDGAFRLRTMKFYSPANISGRIEESIPGFP